MKVNSSLFWFWFFPVIKFWFWFWVESLISLNEHGWAQHTYSVFTHSNFIWWANENVILEDLHLKPNKRFWMRLTQVVVIVVVALKCKNHRKCYGLKAIFLYSSKQILFSFQMVVAFIWNNEHGMIVISQKNTSRVYVG